MIIIKLKKLKLNISLPTRMYFSPTAWKVDGYFRCFFFFLAVIGISSETGQGLFARRDDVDGGPSNHIRCGGYVIRLYFRVHKKQWYKGHIFSNCTPYSCPKYQKNKVWVSGQNDLTLAQRSRVFMQGPCKGFLRGNLGSSVIMRASCSNPTSSWANRC